MGQNIQAAGDRYCSSTKVVEARAALYYSQAWNHRSLILPDVSIHPSLQTYSYSDSDARLQRYLDGATDSAYRRAGGGPAWDPTRVPGFVKEVGEKLAPFTAIPNTVGLGALVISMMLQTILGGKASGQPDVTSALRGVLNDQKSEAVRVTMQHYLKQHRIYVRNPEQLKEEARDTVKSLSKELSALKDVMMQSGQTKSLYVKQWVNGGAFHVLIMAHMANMNHSACDKFCSKQRYVTKTQLAACVQRCSAQRRLDARGAMDYYAAELPAVLERYQAYKVDTTEFDEWGNPGPDWESKRCCIKDLETGERLVWKCQHIGCKENAERYRRVYARLVLAGPVGAELRTYFADLASNLDDLMTRPGAALVPPSRLYRDLARLGLGWPAGVPTGGPTTTTPRTPRKAPRSRVPAAVQPDLFCLLVVVLLSLQI